MVHEDVLQRSGNLAASCCRSSDAEAETIADSEGSGLIFDASFVVDECAIGGAVNNKPLVLLCVV
jgi:hypothetical protein